MANKSAVIGLLRVLLSANTAEFETAMKRSADSAKAWSRDLKQIGKEASDVGAALTKTITLPIVGVSVAAAKLAIDFESSFAGVRKTVDGTEAELAGLAGGFRNLAKTIPINVNELNRIGEAAGALGIRKESILEFSEVMAKLGVTTNLTSDQAATSIAQIQNIFNAAGKDTKNFASALVALGNDGASTEAQIVDFAARLSGAGHQIGLSQQSVLGFSAALANMGLNAELGGTALSKVMSKMSVAVDTGGEKLKAFADVAKMPAAAFRDMFKSNPTEAILRFTEGLGKSGMAGENLTIILNDLGLKGGNVQDVLKRLAGGADQMRKAVDLSAKAWRENSALDAEAAKRFETTASKLTLLGNRFKDVGITLGNALGPALDLAIVGMNALIPVLETMVRGFNALPDGVQLGIIGIAGLVAAVGPAIYVFGQLATAAAAVTGAFAAKGLASRLLLADLGFLGTALQSNLVAASATVTQYGAMGAASIGVTTATRALGAAMLAMPWAAATAGAAAVAAGLVYLYGRSKELELQTQTQAAKQDAINRAISHGAATTINYADAIKFNTEWEEKRINAFNRAHRGANSLTEAQQQLAAATAKYNQELGPIKTALEFQIRHMSETGKSVQDLAKEFGISELTVTRFQASLQGTTGAVKNNTAALGEVPAVSREAQHALDLLEVAHRHQAAALDFETSAWKQWEQTVSKALSSIPKAVLTSGITGLDPQKLYSPGDFFGSVPVRQDTIGPTPLDPSKIDMGAWGKGIPDSQRQSFWANAFGSPMLAGQQLAATIVGAFQGGGSAVASAAGALGSGIGGNIGQSLVKDGPKFFASSLGKVFAGAIPVIGSLLGPLTEKIWGALFGTEGRDTKNAMAKQAFGSVEEMQRLMVETLSKAQYDSLWKKFSEVGQNNKEQAIAAVEAITAALDAQKKKQDEVAAAAKASAEAQQAALDAITDKYKSKLDELASEYKSLSDSVSKEAEEEVMGITEMRERERMKQIEDERKAIEAQRDAEIAAKKETFAETLTEAEKLDKSLKEMFERGYKSPVKLYVDASGLGPVISPAALSGGHDSGMTDGWEGRTPAGALPSGGGTAQIFMDGQMIAEAAVPHIPGVVNRLVAN